MCATFISYKWLYTYGTKSSDKNSGPGGNELSDATVECVKVFQRSGTVGRYHWRGFGDHKKLAHRDPALIPAASLTDFISGITHLFDPSGLFSSVAFAFILFLAAAFEADQGECQEVEAARNDFLIFTHNTLGGWTIPCESSHAFAQ